MGGSVSEKGVVIVEINSNYIIIGNVYFPSRSDIALYNHFAIGNQ